MRQNDHAAAEAGLERARTPGDPLNGSTVAVEHLVLPEQRGWDGFKTMRCSHT
jgi:hypothetical protein